MKLSTTLLFVLLVLFAASAAFADDAQAPSVEAPTVEVTAEEAPAQENPLTPAESCQPGTDGLIAKGGVGQETAPAAQTCGSCSTSNCRGAIRGQMCYLGSGQGWGNCNIFSGGYMCPEGGWDCQCSGGVLP